MLAFSAARPTGSGQSAQNTDYLFDATDLSGVPIPYDRSSEIYGEGEPAEYVYKVLSGAVRTCKILADGRRQINAFYLPGDVFGLEPGSEHAWSAEAVADSKILLVRRNVLLATSQRDADVSHRLWAATAKELGRAQEHALLLIKSAQERVAAFLLDLASRLPSAIAVELPMSRQDIADYLGLTIETVSRTLTVLRGESTIELLGTRRIALRNRAVLSEMNN